MRKLSENDVIEIRGSSEPTAALAARYGVAGNTIRVLRRGVMPTLGQTPESLGLAPIPGASGYFISEDGRVFSNQGHGPGDGTGRALLHELRQSEAGHGYKKVNIRESGTGMRRRFVHQLVLRAFVGPRPEPSMQARHLDGNKKNNHKDNLAWGTPKENDADNVKHGTQRGSRNPRAKLSEHDVVEIRRAVAAGAEKEAVAARFGITRLNVNSVLAGRTWAHVPTEEVT